MASILSLGAKKALFLACFERYRHSIVDPAFGRVEQVTADIGDIADYFEHQIALAEGVGLPGLGCFVSNASTETAPQDADVAARVLQHNQRLEKGFLAALKNSVQPSSTISSKNLAQLASVLVIFTNGLWSLSRNTVDASILRDVVASFLDMIREILK